MTQNEYIGKDGQSHFRVTDGNCVCGCTIINDFEWGQHLQREEAVVKDEAELKLLIGHDDKLVRIEFGKPIAWIAMPKAQALEFAFSVLSHCGVQIEHKVQQDPAPGDH